MHVALCSLKKGILADCQIGGWAFIRAWACNRSLTLILLKNVERPTKQERYLFFFFYSLDEHNCLIAYSGLVDDHFPWAQFCLVVEYEYQSDSVWKDNCERQNIRHIALKLNSQDKSGNYGW